MSIEYKEARTRTYREGQIVFVEGDPAFEAFIVLSGSVAVSIGQGKSRKVLDIITKNQMFGEMAIIADMPRTATVVCLEPTELVVVDRSLIEPKIREMDPYIKYLMESLIDRLFRTSRWTDPQPKRVLEVMPPATEYALARESDNATDDAIEQEKDS